MCFSSIVTASSHVLHVWVFAVVPAHGSKDANDVLLIRWPTSLQNFCTAVHGSKWRLPMTVLKQLRPAARGRAAGVKQKGQTCSVGLIYKPYGVIQHSAYMSPFFFFSFLALLNVSWNLMCYYPLYSYHCTGCLYLKEWFKVLFLVNWPYTITFLYQQLPLFHFFPLSSLEIFH